MNFRYLSSWFLFALVWAAIPNRVQAQPAFREQASLPEAGKYLHERMEWWLTWKRAEKDQGTVCMSCHTTLPYLLAQSVFRFEPGKDKQEAWERMLKSVRYRVQHWDTVEPYTKTRPGQSRGSESILNLVALALYDSATGKKQASDDTRQALSHLWSLQIKTGNRQGAWEWIEAGLAPWELRSDYFGASLAAFGLASIPGYLSNVPEQDRKHLELLRQFLKSRFPQQNLHDRLTLAWASGKWPELLSDEDKQRLLDEVLAKQNPDGGWSAASLGNWKRADNKEPPTGSDGYGTALVVASLKRLARGEQRKSLDRGQAWLRTHQHLDGSWRAESLNKGYPKGSEPGLFLTDAATGWAVLALSE